MTEGGFFVCLLVCAMVNASSFLCQLKFLHVFNSDVDIVFGASVLADLPGTSKPSTATRKDPKELISLTVNVKWKSWLIVSLKSFCELNISHSIRTELVNFRSWKCRQHKTKFNL